MDALPILVYKGFVQSDPYGHPFQRSSHRHFLLPILTTLTFVHLA